MKKTLIAFIFCFALAAGSRVNAQGETAKAESKNAKPAIAVGEIAPDFTLSASGGGTVTLSKVGGPTVLVFYRGYW